MPIDDIREVSNYVDAMMYGLERLEKLPMSLRLIREMHERLLQSGRGGTKNPGEFRRSQNWIGGSRPGNALFVPPPVTEMKACIIVGGTRHGGRVVRKHCTSCLESGLNTIR
jgi:Fic family protein